MSWWGKTFWYDFITWNFANWKFLYYIYVCMHTCTNISIFSCSTHFTHVFSAASETGSDYHPIFFAQDRLLEELFCICIQLVNKTWKEMRATQEDFDKVDHHRHHHLCADRDFFTSSVLSLCCSALTETKLYFTLFIAYFPSEIHV